MKHFPIERASTKFSFELTHIHTLRKNTLEKKNY